MDILIGLAIIAILFGYLNLWLILKKEKPTIIIKNIIPRFGTDKENNANSSNKSHSHPETVKEVPIETHVTVKDVDGKVNLGSEKVGTSNVSAFTEKIKKLRSK